MDKAIRQLKDMDAFEATNPMSDLEKEAIEEMILSELLEDVHAAAVPSRAALDQTRQSKNIITELKERFGDEDTVVESPVKTATLPEVSAGGSMVLDTNTFSTLTCCD